MTEKKEIVVFDKEDYINFPQFNNRFKRFFNPDWNDWSLMRGVNEFSIHADLAFEKHLKYLKKFATSWRKDKEGARLERLKRGKRIYCKTTSFEGKNNDIR